MMIFVSQNVKLILRHSVYFSFLWRKAHVFLLTPSGHIPCKKHLCLVSILPENLYRTALPRNTKCIESRHRFLV